MINKGNAFSYSYTNNFQQCLFPPLPVFLFHYILFKIYYINKERLHDVSNRAFIDIDHQYFMVTVSFTPQFWQWRVKILSGFIYE